jgi:hypothetical protein
MSISTFLANAIALNVTRLDIDANGDYVINAVPRTGTISQLTTLTSGGVGELASSPTEKAIVMLNGSGAPTVFKADTHVYIRTLTDTGGVDPIYDVYIQPFGVSGFSINQGKEDQTYIYKAYSTATDYDIRHYQYKSSSGWIKIGSFLYSTTFTSNNLYPFNVGSLAQSNAEPLGRTIIPEPGFRNLGIENVPARFGTTIGDYAVGYTDGEISFGFLRGIGQQTRDGKIGLYAMTTDATSSNLISEYIDPTPAAPEIVVNKKFPTILYIEISVKDLTAFTWMILKRSWIVGSTGNDGVTLAQLQAPLTIGTDYIGIAGVTAGAITFTVDNTNSIARMTLNGVAGKTLSATAYVEVRTLGVD